MQVGVRVVHRPERRPIRTTTRDPIPSTKVLHPVLTRTGGIRVVSLFSYFISQSTANSFDAILCLFSGGGGPSPYQPSSVGGAWSGQPPPHQHSNRPHTDLPNLAALGSSLGLTAATAGSPAPPGAAQLTSMGALNLGALPVGSALVAAALNQAGWGGLFSSLQGPQAPPPQQQQQQPDGSGGPGSYPTAAQQHQAMASVGMPLPAPNSGPGGGASGLLGWGESPGPVTVTTPSGVQQQPQQAGTPQSQQQQQQQAPWGQRQQQEGPGPKGPPYTMKYD